MGSSTGDRAAEAAEVALRIIGRLHRLPEPAMRTAVLAERLLCLPVEGAVDVMSALVELIRPGELPSTLAMLALSEFLGEGAGLDYDRRADWYRAARRGGHDSLARMLLPREAKLTPPKTHAASDPVAVYLKRQVPLGEKRSLARGKDKHLLERLLLDPHPLVVRNLLLNPALTEEWVLRIATQRPVSPTILREVSDSAGWFGRYRVRLALARNPYTPTDLAIRCVPELQAPDLFDMADDGTLHSEVRLAASEEFGRRRPARIKPAGPSRVVGGGRRSAAGVRGRPISDGLGGGGGDVDLVLTGDRPLEVHDSLAQSVAELGDLRSAEHQDHDGQDDEEFGTAEADGEGHLVHGPTLSGRPSEGQRSDVSHPAESPRRGGGTPAGLLEDVEDGAD